jgi:hypothetical protein
VTHFGGLGGLNPQPPLCIMGFMGNKDARKPEKKKPKRKKPKREDINQIAFRVVQESTKDH